MQPDLAEFCIYTIKHSTDLERGSKGTFRERCAWVSGKRMLDEAKRRGERLPIIFCPAEYTQNLHSWGVLEKVEITGNETAYTFSHLTRFKAARPKTVLKKKSDGKPLAAGYIRPYAICQTPGFLR